MLSDVLTIVKRDITPTVVQGWYVCECVCVCLKVHTDVCQLWDVYFGQGKLQGDLVAFAARSPY